MRIDDKELSDLFEAECAEHLQTLDEGLLRLEAHPSDPKLLEALFRSAHSLKGSARMLGLADIEAISHIFEDELGAARRGTVALNAETADRLYAGVDAMRKLVREAVSGEPSGVEVERVLASLKGVEETPEVADASDFVPEPHSELPKAGPVLRDDEAGLSSSLATQETPSESAESAPSSSSFLPGSEPLQFETIRVETQQLDALMTRAGELVVVRSRIRRLLEKINAFMDAWEEGGKGETTPAYGIGALGKRSRERSREETPRFNEREQTRLDHLEDILQSLQSAAAEDSAQLDQITSELEEEIQAIRLLPFSTVFNLFPRMVRDLARQQAKEVQLVIEGGDTKADKRIIEEIKDPLMHMLRNAVDHGIEPPNERKAAGKPAQAILRLSTHRTATSIEVELSDDGRGIDIVAVRRVALQRGVVREEQLREMSLEQTQALIFAPGFTTSETVTDVSGRGIGLDVVRNNVERLKGSLQLSSEPGIGTTFKLRLPLTLTTARVFIVEAGTEVYALPIEYIQSIRHASSESLFPLGHLQTLSHEGQPISVGRLSDLLELPGKEGPLNRDDLKKAASASGELCLVIEVGEERFGLLVDGFVSEQEVVLKPLGGLLKRVRNISGATILETGEICMILNPSDLFRKLQRHESPAPHPVVAPEAERKRRVLLVEDSITTRTQEKRILETAGYFVVTAVDGLDALNKLSADTFDAVVSDVEMPNMDGLTLAEKIRQNSKYQDLPILLVTSLASDEDRKRGLQVGANAYLTKPAFDQKEFLSTLKRLA
jgi:two-component system chemotaxis sensor kinase CheA